jgi:hypothetical protein
MVTASHLGQHLHESSFNKELRGLSKVPHLVRRDPRADCQTRLLPHLLAHLAHAVVRIDAVLLAVRRDAARRLSTACSDCARGRRT